MNLTMNTRVIDDQVQINCIGYFQCNFFDIDSLLKKQAEIYAYISENKSFISSFEEMTNLYDITEHMRVKLLASNPEKAEELVLENELSIAKKQLLELCVSECFTDKQVRELAPIMAIEIRKLQNRYDGFRAKDINVIEEVHL